MKLIINADDFGRTRGINYGIVEAIKNGVLSSTTIMMNMPYAEHAINLAKKEGITSIGVHLTFIEKSLSLGKTLVDKDGIFKKYPELMKEADIEEIKTEMRVQIDKLIDMGIKPTHLDGHHHVHLYSLKMTEAVYALLNTDKRYIPTLFDFAGKCRMDMFDLLNKPMTKEIRWQELQFEPDSKIN